MKLRILPFLLVIIALSLSACRVVIDYYMTVIPLSIDGCTISVSVAKSDLIEYEDDRVFIDSPEYYNGLNMRTLYDVGEDDEFTIDILDSLAFDGVYNVVQYVYTSGRWYFQIVGNGDRTVVFIQSLFAGVSDSNRKDITDAGLIWVDGDYVEEFDEPFLRCDETEEIINVIEPGDESVNRFYMCRVDVTEPEVPGRVGPGENRAIRAYLTPNADGYGVSAQNEDDEGNLWYELDVPDLGFLWVLASQTDDFDHLFINDEMAEESYLNDCSEYGIPTKEVPIIESQTVNNPDIENPDCEGFELISPLGNVPTGSTTFEWTAVPDADEYIVMFYSYTNEFAAQFAVTTNFLNINTGDIPTGSQLSWEVYALRDSEIFCRTGRSGTLTRLAQEVIIIETEEPVVEEEKDKNKGGGGYTPPEEDPPPGD